MDRAAGAGRRPRDAGGPRPCRVSRWSPPRGWPALALCPPDHVGVGKKHAKTCDSRGKMPLVRWKGYQERLPSEADVRGWWGTWPNANVGVALGGPGRLARLDVDGPLGEAE